MALAAGAFCLGSPDYRSRVPNGAVNDKSTGHDGGQPFRWDFRDIGIYAWTIDLCNADTDGDGLTDGVETNTGTLVDNDDTGTNPNNADTDGDGYAE